MNLRDLINKHESSGKSFKEVGWLSLKNDGDNIKVRFLHTDDNDFDVYEVHELEIDGFKTKVKCLGENCPLCGAVGAPKLRAFFQMINLADGSHKIWERGIGDIKALIAEVEDEGDLCNHNYLIRRNGVAGSTKTTYLFKVKEENKEPLPKRVKVEGFYVKVLTREEMLMAINGKFTFKKTTTEISDDDLVPVEDTDIPF